jgi:hypothetical protein
MKNVVYRVYTTLREHQEGCSFFDGFGILMQLIMGSLVFSSLVFKWWIEKPRRELLIFTLDSSKQIIGQFTQHVFNILVSSYVGNHESVECEWYIVNLLNDSSFGLIIQYLILMLFTYLFTGTRFEFHSGDYGNNISGKYFLQIIVWIIIVIIVIYY